MRGLQSAHFLSPWPSLNPTPLLATDALVFERGSQPVFGPLDLSLQAGGLLLVEGDNGAGKTTLLRVLAGLARPASGRIHFDGQLAGPTLHSRYVAYLGHLPGLKAELDCIDNLHSACGLLGRRARQTVPGALGIVGLAGMEQVPVRQLSAGQRKRLALARLWLSPAPLWLLDEPYANLDAAGIDLVERMLAAHLRSGGAALLTSHGAHNRSTQAHQVVRLPEGTPA